MDVVTKVVFTCPLCGRLVKEDLWAKPFRLRQKVLHHYRLRHLRWRW